MKKYLIDVNLPRYFSLWSSDEYEHVININDEMTDREIWDYAKENNLTIVTKDTDFADLMLLSEPPPRVIHVRLGNMKMKEFHSSISKVWEEVCLISEEYKLVSIHKDRIEGIG